MHSQDLAPAPDLAAAREAQILQSLRQACARDGFDGSSMQRLARAAGMSVGNFYRYFPSKAAMIEALIRHDIARIEQDFAAITRAADPFAALRDGIHRRIREHDPQQAALWAEIQAVSLRRPECAAITRDLEAEIITWVLRAFATSSGMGEQQTRDRFEDQARLLVMLVKMSAMRPPDAATPAMTRLLIAQADAILAAIPPKAVR